MIERRVNDGTDEYVARARGFGSAAEMRSHFAGSTLDADELREGIAPTDDAEVWRALTDDELREGIALKMRADMLRARLALTATDDDAEMWRAFSAAAASVLNDDTPEGR